MPPLRRGVAAGPPAAMSMLPRLSHLQFLVIGVLRGRTLAGRQLRDALSAFGVHKSGPGFYQLMARLEDAGLVDGDYTQEVVDGQIIRERHYRVTGAGSRAWRVSRDFYAGAIRELEADGGLAGA